MITPGNRISTRLTLLTTTSATLALLFSTLLILELTRTQLQADFEKRILTQSQLVAASLEAAVVFEDWDTAEELARSLLLDKAVCSVSVLNKLNDAKVTLVRSCAEHSSGQSWAGTKLSQVFPASVVQKQHPVRVADSNEGAILIAASNREVLDALGQLLVKIASVSLGALLLMVWFTVRGQSKLIEPISLLSDTAKKVRETGNYQLRGPVIGNNEISQLATDVNAMLELIEQRDLFLAREIEAGVNDLQQKNLLLEEQIHRLAQADQALEESRERFERAFQNAPIGMAIADRSGKIVQANQAIDVLLKTSSKGKRLQGFLSAAANESFSTALSFVFSTYGAASKESYEIRDAQGETLTCNLSLSAIPNAEGQLQHCILQVEDVTKAAKLSAELAFQAQHDALTGLGNRRVLEASLSKANAAASQTPFSLALLDLDQFKIVNDTCGHEAGDRLLSDVAKLLKDAVRSDDIVVRLGGDEFALLLRDCLQDNALKVAEKVRSDIENMVFYWQGESFRIGTSIGLVTIETPLSDPSDALRRADAACFAAKDAGRNRVYHAKEDDRTLARNHGEMHWVNKIQTALDEDQFVLHAQPIVALQPHTGRPRMEVLLRLRDYENRRLIPPGAFLPAVERYGMSGKLDRWVVSTLLMQIKAYRHQFDDARSYWVNLSGLSLSDPMFLEYLETAIRDAQLPTGTVNFEVTETAVISNLSAASEAMERLRQLGCRFALDDFGSGVSTFGYLRNLPIDFVKIDGSFVRNLINDEADRIFVKSVIDIVRVLELRTVVEFVEDMETARLLTLMGADFGQGFALGRPAPLLPAPAFHSQEVVRSTPQS